MSDEEVARDGSGGGGLRRRSGHGHAPPTGTSSVFFHVPRTALPIVLVGAALVVFFLYLAAGAWTGNTRAGPVSGSGVPSFAEHMKQVPTIVDAKHTRTDGTYAYIPSWNTHEYQIKLKKEQWGTARREALNEVLEYFEVNTPLRMRRAHAKEFLREQYTVHTEACFESEVQSRKVRVRNIVQGNDNAPVGTSYVDVKFLVPGFHSYGDEERLEPILPAKNQTNGWMKREQDVHPCHSRWSRATRIYNVTFEPQWKTCRDVAALFPGMYEPSYLDNAVKATSHPEIWWEYTNVGEWEGVRFQSTFTLKYKSVADALAGTNLDSGRSASEWSLRLWVDTEDAEEWAQSEHLKKKTFEWYLPFAARFDEQQENCIKKTHHSPDV